MNKFKSFIIILALALGIGFNVDAATTTQQSLNLENPIQTAHVSYMAANPLDMIARPSFYLNKNVKIRAKFDKFSTLGLDYTPAMRSSEDYISFLIQRPDVPDHNIPLSEMKIFLKRSEAEKHIDLNSGDEIEFSGKVFSKALGDIWMDVDKFVVLTTKPKNEKESK